MAEMHVGIVQVLKLSSCGIEYFNNMPDAKEVSQVLVVVSPGLDPQTWRASQTIHSIVEGDGTWRSISMDVEEESGGDIGRMLPGIVQ